jgi:mediator of RNA polymerase II transcription subunit 18
LRYAAQPELLGHRPTLVRSILDIACGSEVAEFLKELGCRREFDYITKGYLFRKGRIKITVGKIYRFDAKLLQDNYEAITSSHYVEMSVVCPTGQDVVGEDMKALAEQLKPLVILDKVDARR